MNTLIEMLQDREREKEAKELRANTKFNQRWQ